jgi:Periplasmic binding protein
MGLNPALVTEAHIYAKHILETKPNAKVGVLFQNDVLGKPFLAGVRDGLGSEHAGMIVKEASYEVSDPTVDSQIVALQGAGADTLIIVATAKPAAQAIRKAYDIGWTPQRYLFSGAASIIATLKPAGLDKSIGVITAVYGKDPTDSRWKDDPGYKEFAAFVTKYIVSFRRCHIGDLNSPLAPHCFFKRASWYRLKGYASTCLKKFRHIVRRHKTKHTVLVEIEAAEFGIADADRLLQHGRKNWLKLAWGA